MSKGPRECQPNTFSDFKACLIHPGFSHGDCSGRLGTTQKLLIPLCGVGYSIKEQYLKTDQEELVWVVIQIARRSEQIVAHS